MRPRDVYGREDVLLVTAAQSAALDQAARERGGVPERVLMENAGRSAALVLQRLFPRGRVVAVAGSGNNGGDALVLLRSLQAWGRDVACIPVGSAPPPAALAHGHGVAMLTPDVAQAAFAGAEVLLDGMLGTGSAGAPREPIAGMIQQLNASGRPILALDLPSGVDATTGAVPARAVRATVTVTFGWPKLGLLFHPARSHCGRLIAVEIGFPPSSYPPAELAALITPAWAAARLPVRPPDAHKGTAGRLLALVGSTGMAGAAALVGMGAVRAGAGLVRLATTESNREIVQRLVPDAVFVNRDDDDGLAAAAADVAAVVAGPGLGRDAAALRVLERTLALTRGRPTLLDADALTLFAENGALATLARERPLLLTPHPGEMARLSAWTVERIRSEPVSAARELAARVRAAVLLKGAPSIVATPDEAVLVNTVGSSDLASAGMGDQLAGTIAAFLAGGVEPRTAAALGLFYSGRAADLAAKGRALTPEDVAEHLDRAFQYSGARRSPLALPFVIFDQPARW